MGIRASVGIGFLALVFLTHHVAWADDCIISNAVPEDAFIVAFPGASDRDAPAERKPYIFPPGYGPKAHLRFRGKSGDYVAKHKSWTDATNNKDFKVGVEREGFYGTGPYYVWFEFSDRFKYNAGLVYDYSRPEKTKRRRMPESYDNFWKDLPQCRDGWIDCKEAQKFFAKKFVENRPRDFTEVRVDEYGWEGSFMEVEPGMRLRVEHEVWTAPDPTVPREARSYCDCSDCSCTGENSRNCECKKCRCTKCRFESSDQSVESRRPCKCEDCTPDPNDKKKASCEKCQCGDCSAGINESGPVPSRNGFVKAATEYLVVYRQNAAPDGLSEQLKGDFITFYPPVGYLKKYRGTPNYGASRLGWPRQAGSGIDLELPADPFKFYRLSFPDEFQQGDDATLRQAKYFPALMGANDRSLLIKDKCAQALEKVWGKRADGEPFVTSFSRGRAWIHPEVQVRVRNEYAYVPVGITRGQLLQTFMEIADDREPRGITMRRRFNGEMRAVKFLGKKGQWKHLQDIPLLKGDEIQW